MKIELFRRKRQQFMELQITKIFSKNITEKIRKINDFDVKYEKYIFGQMI